MEMWFSEFHTPDVKHSIRVNRQLYSKQSDYQRIDIFETPEFGRVLTLDGNVMLTERDEFIYDEMITHVPMAVHKEARDILVIGAGDGGVVRELTRYDRVRRIELVEMEAAQLPRTLSDVDFAVINGNYAAEAGFSASKDALAVEDATSEAAQTYANLLVVEEGNENEPAIKALVAALTSQTVKDYIDSTYDGAVVAVF